MLSNIKLYGELSEKCNGHTELQAVLNRPVDAIRFLINNFDNLESHIIKNNYKVIVDDQDIEEVELDFPSFPQEIKIIPIISGSGNVGRIIAGVVLIGAAIAFSGGAGLGILGKSIFTGGALAPAALAGKVGMFLVLSGVAGLLTPTPDVPEDEGDPTKSFSFSGVQNNARAGIPIPICYGHVLVGSIPVSASITTVDINA
tara:strand:+ start:221 stop:823 length:603 start_codon:yes stop_codon:yes gene_type:complete